MDVDQQISERRWIDVSLHISDEAQVLLITQQHEGARAAQGIDVGVKEAGAWDWLQVATRGIPGICGVNLSLDGGQRAGTS